MFTKEQCLKDFRTFVISESTLLEMAVDLLVKMDDNQFGSLLLNSLGLGALDIVEFCCDLEETYVCHIPAHCGIQTTEADVQEGFCRTTLTVSAWVDSLVNTAQVIE